MVNFWQNLKKQKALKRGSEKGEPILVLAPMADVTDAAFRRIIAKYGKPDAMWTEFVSADGLIRANEKGKRKLMRDLLYSKKERPIVAQLFSANPEYMYKAAQLVAELGFDGLDINMGCPDRGIEKQGAGAALIKDPKQARRVLNAAMRGVADANKIIPVSVKTRIGYNKNELETWLPELLAEKPALITVHARTRKEMSDVPARWEHVKRAVEIRDAFQSETLIFGNGDVAGIEDAKNKARETGADGVMLGRAIFGNPWLFSKNKKPISVKQKLLVMVEHAKLFEKLLGDIKNFSVMKKHFKAYVAGFDGAGELRAELMQTESVKEVEKIVKNFLKSKKP